VTNAHIVQDTIANIW